MENGQPPQRNLQSEQTTPPTGLSSRSEQRRDVMLPIKRKNLYDDLIVLLSCYFLQMKCNKKKRKKPPSVWVNPYLKERGRKGRFATDFEDLIKNPSLFKENFRMSPDRFDVLYGYVWELLKPVKNTRPFDNISAREKLAVTIEFLACGSLLRHVASCYRISKQHLGDIVEDVCDALIKVLPSKCVQEFSTANWIESANYFHERWNMPNCLGSIDGKHCAIKCPPQSGTEWYCYKGFYSMVLMAVASADYKFLFYNVGSYGSEGDSSVFRGTSFGKALLSKTLKLPPPQYLNGYITPFYFVADDAFPLHRNIMKPFKPKTKAACLTDEQLIFNYRLSPARRTVENAFGILCIRWMVLAGTMRVSVSRAQKIIETCCLLHNLLMDISKEDYAPGGFGDQLMHDGSVVEGYWRRHIPPNSLYHTQATTDSCDIRPTDRPGQTAKNMQINIMNYLNSNSGSVTWQRRMALGEHE